MSTRPRPAIFDKAVAAQLAADVLRKHDRLEAVLVHERDDRNRYWRWWVVVVMMMTDVDVDPSGSEHLATLTGWHDLPLLERALRERRG